MSEDRVHAAIASLRAFFAAENPTRATRPLTEGFRVLLALEGGPELLLTKRHGKTQLLEEPAGDVQFRLDVPLEAAEALAAHATSDVPTIAVTLVELLTHPEPQRRVRARVYAGPFELLRKGYFSVIPLGGAPLMRALATQGIGSLSEIRERLKRLKENR